MKLFETFLVLVATAFVASAIDSEGVEDVEDVANAIIAKGPVDEDVNLEVQELVQKYGYPCEKHQVVTEDRYVLTMFRIPHGSNHSSQSGKKGPVLLQHGLMNSAIDWVIMGPQKSLAYILADRGYDVWLGNVRGNVYSQKHLDMGPEDKEFWKFSWHENGYYDVPAQIDYVLNATSEKKIFYIGHSMGTTMFYVSMSVRPEYNEKIRLMSSLAPIAYMNHMFSPILQFLAPLTHSAGIISSLIGTGKFTPSQELLKVVSEPLCKQQAITQAVCYNPMFLICGFDSTELDKEKLSAILAHVPAGSSTRQFLHYGQGIKDGHFRCYDHGPIKNLALYGSVSPPDYELRKVTAPVALYFSQNDWLAGLKDIDRLYTELGNVVSKHKVELKKFNHIDFVWAKTAWDYVYKYVVQKMEEF